MTATIRTHYGKIGLAIFSLLLFILALDIMKTGARALQPLIQDQLRVNGLLDGMGFGWLSAALILSGSPIAAMALTLYHVGALDSVAAFGMINGSRIGASAMVLLIGLIYSQRRHGRRDSLGVGLLSLIVVQSIQFPAMIVGLVLIRSNLFKSLNLQDLERVDSVIGTLTDPIVNPIARALPDGILFFLGLGLIIVSFRLFDHAVPEVSLERTALLSLKNRLRQPLVMFGLGFGVTLVTMSVSISMGMLVPLSARHLIDREDTVPYMMGAGISTFIDTFIAALILQNRGAITLVMVEVSSISLISLLYLMIAFRRYESAVLSATDYLLNHPRALWAYVATFLLIPLVLAFV